MIYEYTDPTEFDRFMCISCDYVGGDINEFEAVPLSASRHEEWICKECADNADTDCEDEECDVDIYHEDYCGKTAKDMG